MDVAAYVWQLPFPIAILVLLSTGVLVTRREHSNMTKMMEYFRDLSSTQVGTISDQAEALKEYKEAAVNHVKVVSAVQELNDQGGSNARST